MEAKPGKKADDFEELPNRSLARADGEHPVMNPCLGAKLDSSAFGVEDAFPGESGRVAEALMANAPDLLASKLPKRTSNPNISRAGKVPALFFEFRSRNRINHIE